MDGREAEVGAGHGFRIGAGDVPRGPIAAVVPAALSTARQACASPGSGGAGSPFGCRQVRICNGRRRRAACRGRPTPDQLSFSMATGIVDQVGQHRQGAAGPVGDGRSIQAGPVGVPLGADEGQPGQHESRPRRLPLPARYASPTQCGWRGRSPVRRVSGGVGRVEAGRRRGRPCGRVRLVRRPPPAADPSCPGSIGSGARGESRRRGSALGHLREGRGPGLTGSRSSVAVVGSRTSRLGRVGLIVRGGLAASGTMTGRCGS